MKAMKSLIACFVLLCGAALLVAQAPDWQWAVSAGGSMPDYGCGITIDSLGNSYVTGSFSGSAQFGQFTLVSNGDSDVFVAKIDKYGSWVWALSAGGPSEDLGLNITTDNTGYVYVTGYYRGTVCFGNTILNNTNHSDLFIAKISVDGTWIFTVDSGTEDNFDRRGYDIAVDTLGNIYATGQDYSHVLCIKLDSAGNRLWTRTSSNTISTFGKAISISDDGTTYICGGFTSQISFGTNNLTTSANYGHSGFIAAIDTNGNWLWAATNQGIDYQTEYTAIASDSQGSCYITGGYSGEVVFGTHTLQNTNSDYVDVLVAKYNHNVGWIWASSAGGMINDEGTCITYDQMNGGCYLAGYYMDTASFGNETMESNGSSDIFVSKLDSSGNWIKTRHAGSSHSEIIEEIAVDQYGGCYLIGSFEGQSIIEDQILPFAGVSDIIITATHFFDLDLLSNISINFGGVYVNETSDWQPVIIQNLKSIDMIISEIRFSGNQSQFDYLSTGGDVIIHPGQIDSVMVRFSPEVIGACQDTLYVVNNSNNQSVLKITLRGSGLLVSPQSPQNIAIDRLGNDIHLSWDEVTENLHGQQITPDYYLIFGCAKPYGEYVFLSGTQDLHYTAPLTALLQPRMFYRVVAYKYYGRGSFDLEALSIEPGMIETEVLSKLKLAME